MGADNPVIGHSRQVRLDGCEEQVWVGALEADRAEGAVVLPIDFVTGIRVLSLADEIVLAHDRLLGPAEAHLQETAGRAALDASP